MLYQNGEVNWEIHPQCPRDPRGLREMSRGGKSFGGALTMSVRHSIIINPSLLMLKECQKGKNFSWWHSASLRIPPQANQQRKVEPTAWVAEQANPIVECESGKSMEMIKSGWKILKQGFSPIAVNISISFSNIHSTGNPLILQHSHKLKIEKGSEKLSKQYCNLVKSIIVKPS